MKRILFLIVCLMSFSAKADMDNVCNVDETPIFEEVSDFMDSMEFVSEYCKKNNILVWWDLYPYEQITRTIAQYCRFDREIQIVKDYVICVLNDNKPRENLIEYAYPD